MRFDNIFRFLLQGGVGGRGGSSQSNANNVKGRVVPVRAIPHSSTQKFRGTFFTLGLGSCPFLSFGRSTSLSHLILFYTLGLQVRGRVQAAGT